MGFDAPRWATTMENVTVVPATASTRSLTAITSNGATTSCGTVVVDVDVDVEVVGADVVDVAAVGSGADGIVVVRGGAVMVTPATWVGTNRTVVRVVFLVVPVTRFTVVFVVRFTEVDVLLAAEAPGTPDGKVRRNVHTDTAVSTGTTRRLMTLEGRKRRRSTHTMVPRTRADSSDCPMCA